MTEREPGQEPKQERILTPAQQRGQEKRETEQRYREYEQKVAALQSEIRTELLSVGIDEKTINEIEKLNRQVVDSERTSREAIEAIQKRQEEDEMRIHQRFWKLQQKVVAIIEAAGEKIDGAPTADALAMAEQFAGKDVRNASHVKSTRRLADNKLQEKEFPPQETQEKA